MKQWGTSPSSLLLLKKMWRKSASFVSSFLARALVHWWDLRVGKNQQLSFLLYRRNVSRIGVFLKSSWGCNFFIIWSTIKCDTPLELIFHGRLKEILKSGGCLCEIFFKLDLKFLTFAVFVSIERLLEWAATPPIQNSSYACKNLDCPPEIQLFSRTESRSCIGI